MASSSPPRKRIRLALGLAAILGLAHPRAHAQNDPRPKPEGQALSAQKAEFQKVYGLSPGQDLKRIVRPFPPYRDEYAFNSGQPRLPRVAASMKSLVLKEGPKGFNPGWRTFSAPERPFGTTLSSLLVNLADVYPQEVEGEPALIESFVEGDFVIREGLSSKRAVASLETILRNDARLPLRLRLHEETRNVVVARGHYKFRPTEPGHDAIDIYATNTVDNGGGGGSGSFQEMLRWAGRFAEPNYRVISEAVDVPKQDVSWRLYQRGIFTKEERMADHDPADIFEHLGQQTGLTFSFEDRKVLVLTVEKEPIKPNEDRPSP